MMRGLLLVVAAAAALAVAAPAAAAAAEVVGDAAAASVVGPTSRVVDWSGPAGSEGAPVHGNVNYDPARTNTTLVGITREEVAKCYLRWVSLKVPYCQCNGPAECCGSCPYCSTTRCDCSGFVSNCWGLSTGYTTRTLPDITVSIEKEELKPGDIMLKEGEHVAFFGGWTDSSMKYYHVIQEPGCHTNGPHYAYASTTVYPMNWDPSTFKPRRYIHIQD